MNEHLEESLHGTENEYAMIFGSVASIIVLTTSLLVITCCCPRKKSASSESIPVDVERQEETNAQVDEVILPKIILDGKNSRVSVTEMVKSLEKSEKDDKPIDKPLKKIPENKAFQDFESKGIIIGMGRAPKRQSREENGGTNEFEIPIQVEGNSTTEQDDECTLEMSASNNTVGSNIPKQVDTVTTVTRTVTSKLPDVVHDNSLDEDEFAAIERNSGVLSSFRKPPPPRRRSSGRTGKSPRRPASSPLNQSAVDPSLNQWSSVIDNFSFGPPLGSSSVTTTYTKVTRHVQPDGRVVETTETSRGLGGKPVNKVPLMLETPTIEEVEEPGAFPNDDTMCETLKRTRKMSSQKQHFAYDDSDMGTLKKRKQGERLVKHFPVENTSHFGGRNEQFLKSLNRRTSNGNERCRGTLILDQYGNLVLNKSS